MSCTICTKTKPIPQCSGVLTIGAVTPTDVMVVVKEVITNRQRLIEGTVTLGILTIDLPDLGEFLSPNFLYNIEAYDTSLENYGNPIDITIDESVYTCLELSVVPILATDGDMVGPDMVLQIDE